MEFQKKYTRCRFKAHDNGNGLSLFDCRMEQQKNGKYIAVKICVLSPRICIQRNSNFWLPYSYPHISYRSWKNLLHHDRIIVFTSELTNEKRIWKKEVYILMAKWIFFLWFLKMCESIFNRNFKNVFITLNKWA